MEDVACNKELIYEKGKKMKGNFEENHLSDHDEKRKSKSRKRKKSRNEYYERNIYNEPHKNKETKETDNGFNMITRDNTDSDVENLNQTEVLKKKKKMKVNFIENPNLEVDYDEKYLDHGDLKYRKKKKRRKKDIENPEIKKVNRNVESRLPTETSTEIINPETNTERISSNINTKHINSLNSHNYNMDPKKMDFRNHISKLEKKKRFKTQMYEDFMYKPPIIEEKSCGKIEKIPKSCNYWLKQNSKYQLEDYPQEVVQKNLLERIQYIADYFDKFDSDNLTEEECLEKKLSNFDGPYLPTPQHIKYFGDLNIEIDWEVPEEQQLLFTFKTRGAVVKSGLPFVRYSFIKSEDKIMLNNWKKFQEQYKFYDLRPLLGLRTMRVYCEGGHYTFEPVDYLDSNERYKFLLYIARGLEKRSREQVFRRLIQIAMRIQDNEIIYISKRFESKEVAEIEAFIKLFGAHYKGMEFLLGRVNWIRYSIFSKMHIKYKNVPMRYGAWQSTEISRLIRALFRTTNASSIQELINSSINWGEVFPLFQTRHRFILQAYFRNILKRKLEMASYVENHQIDVAKLNWTSNDIIKLIKLVSENLGPTHDETDWEKISTHFEVFGPKSCNYWFYTIYKRVPHNKRTSFKAAVDYIITDIVPQIEKGLINFGRGGYSLEELRSIPLKKGQNTTSSHDWSLKNTIKLIEEVYENAGSSVETTSWSEISSHFKNYDEKSCKNHYRFLYYNRVPHKHRGSFDSALEYLKNFVCPMLKQKKKRNKRETLLTEEVVNLSAEDRSILQGLQNGASQADDDVDIAMLQENNEHLQGQESQSSSIDCHEISLSQKNSRMNELANYIEVRQQEDEIDGDLEDCNENKVDSYLEDLYKEENEDLDLSSKDDITDESFLQDGKEFCSNEDSKTCGIGMESSDKEDKKVLNNDCDEYKIKKKKKKKKAKKYESRRTHDLSDDDD